MASKEQVNNFINALAPVIVNMCAHRGWGVPSAIIAQAGIESAWGTSKLGSLYDKDSCYNFFGMKWREGCGCQFKTFQTKEQRTDGSYYTISAAFRKYASISDGMEGYANFIEGYNRYKPVMAAKDYKTYANQLKACGWATSIAYATNIIKTVESHNLSALYDNWCNSSNITQEKYKQGDKYTLLSDLYVRQTPNGQKLKYDGLTPDGKAHGKFDEYGLAILNKGTKVTCKRVAELETSTWIEIPSGWICAKNSRQIFVE